MQPVHAVIFDLDGTLVDTLADLGTSMNRTLEKNGFPAWPLEAYRQMVGNGMRHLTERALGEGAAPETVERILGDFLALYDRDCTRLSVPYEGMTDTLDRMREQGIALAVVTNKTEEQANKIIRHFFGPDRFAAVYGNLPGRRTKPDPAATWEALEKLHTRAENALFVGDSNVDVQTAKNAGISCVGAIWGFRGEEELRRAGADWLVRCPRELLALIK